MNPESDNQLGEILDDFLAKFREGQRPSVSEYANLHPQMAERLKELIPMLAVMEQAGSGSAAEESNVSDNQPDASVLAALEQQAGYRVLRQIGKGGMGVVYEAIQLTLGRHVALKVLPACFASDASRMDRFQCEAKAAAQLHHTHIVPVFEVGQAGGVGFYAMQYILGHSLDRVLDELRQLRSTEEGGESKPASALSLQIARSLAGDPAAKTLPFNIVDLESPAPTEITPEADTDAIGADVDTERVFLQGVDSSMSSASISRRVPYHRSVARIGIQVAEALQYAHQKGILHRDIKPANLLLDTQGQTWITDFGLAKIADHDLTTDGDVVGTLRYMAPERFSGLADARSDVYSLGLTLWELLTLRPAFTEVDRLKLMRQVAHHSVPPVRQLEPSVPKDLETILRKATDRDPDRRYSTSQEFADDLQRFIDCKPILARRTDFVERSWRWCQRNPVVAGLMAAVILVTCVGVLGIVYQWQEAVEQGQRASRSAHAAQQNFQTAQVQRDEARQANLTLTQTLERLRKVTYAAQMNLAKSYWDQGAFDRIGILLDQQVPHAGQKDLRGFEWYYLDQLRQSCPGTLNEFAEAVTFVSYDPTGERLAAVSADRQVTVWDVNSGLNLATLRGDQGEHFFGAKFDPLGRWLATVDESGAVTLWDAKTYERKQRFEDHEGFGTSIAFSPDGRYLASTSFRRPDPGRVALRDLETGEIVWRHDSCRAVGQSIEFTADSKALLVVGATGQLVHLQLPQATQTEVVSLPNALYGIVSIADQRVACAAQNGSILIYDLARNELLQTLSGGPGFPFALAVSNDTQRLAVAANWVRLWEIDSGELLSEFPQQQPRCLAFHPSEPRLAIGSTNRLIRFWDTQIKSGMQQREISPRSLDGLRFAGDRSVLVGKSRQEVLSLDLESGVSVPALQLSGRRFEAIDTSADGRWVVTTTDQRLVQIWERASGQVESELQLSRPIVSDLCLSGDGDLLAVAYGHDWLGIWRRSGDGGFDLLHETRFAGEELQRLAFSPDRHWLAVGLENGGVACIDLHQDFALKSWKAHQKAVVALDFESSTGRLATGSVDRTFAVWEVGQEEPLVRMASHAQPLVALCYQPGGGRLATLGREGTVKLWDSDGYDELLTLQVETVFGHDLAFSPDGQTIATCWSDGIVRWWTGKPTLKLDR